VAFGRAKVNAEARVGASKQAEDEQANPCGWCELEIPSALRLCARCQRKRMMSCQKKMVSEEPSLIQSRIRDLHTSTRGFGSSNQLAYDDGGSIASAGHVMPLHHELFGGGWGRCWLQAPETDSSTPHGSLSSRSAMAWRRHTHHRGGRNNKVKERAKENIIKNITYIISERWLSWHVHTLCTKHHLFHYNPTWHYPRRKPG
jgi:hypothetical protein